jgi:ADP-heptose:LPS heptosyltransferase
MIVECQRPLIKLLARCSGIDWLIAAGDELPAFDVHAPLLSVPGILGTSLDTIPAEIPYLFADPALVAQWGERLEGVRGPRIGINWRGRPKTRQRDIPIECIRSLAELSGMRFISLQKGEGRAEMLSAIPDRSQIVDLGDDFDTTHGAFMDSAAIMMNLDLVISSDTSVPHLAGALGVPVWLALPFGPDWRWLLDRNDSPWYPTMRLFRQKTPGDWNGIFDEIRAELHKLFPGAP